MATDLHRTTAGGSSSTKLPPLRRPLKSHETPPNRVTLGNLSALLSLSKGLLLSPSARVLLRYRPRSVATGAAAAPGAPAPRGSFLGST
jgi:hypothetical protein